MYAWRLDTFDFALDAKVGALAFAVIAANSKLHAGERLADLQKYFAALLLPKDSKLMITDKKKRVFKTATDKQLASDVEHQKQSFMDQSLASDTPAFGSTAIEFDFDEKGTENNGKSVVPPRRGSAYTDYSVYDKEAEDIPTHTALGSLLLNADMIDLDQEDSTAAEPNGDDQQQQLIQSKLRINSLESKVRQQKALLDQCKCADLRGQVSLLTLNNTTITSEKVVLLERITSVEVLLVSSNNDNAALKKRIVELEVLLAARDAALLASGAAAERNNADLAALQRAKEAADAELAALKKENASLKAELDGLKSANDTFSTRLHDLSLELDSLELAKTDKQELAEQVQRLRAASFDDATKLSKLKYANEMLTGEVDKLNGELADAKAKAAADATGAARLASELAALRAAQAAEKEDLQRLDSDLHAQLRRLSAELEAAQNQANATASAEAVAAAAAAHEAKVAELNGELEALKAADADLKAQLLASQVAHQSAVAKHHAAAANAFGTPLKKPPAAQPDSGSNSPKTPAGSAGRLTGGDLKFAEMEEELYEIRFKVIEHHNELISLIGSIHLEAPLEPLQPLDAGHLPKTRKPFTPTKSMHTPHDIDLSNGKVSELQVSITSNKARLAAMLEMGENLKKGGSRLNLLDGSTGTMSRRGSELSVLDSSGMSHGSSSANLLSKRGSRHSMYELTNDPDYGLNTPLKSSPLNAADDARATQLLQHIQELSAIVDTDELILDRLRIVVDLVNRQLDSSATSLKDAMKRIFELENSLHSTGSHVDGRIAIINKMDADRATLEKQKNDEIMKLKTNIAELNMKLVNKTAELSDLHAHIVEIESHVHQTSLEFHSVYSVVTKTTVVSQSFTHEQDVAATNKKRMKLLTSTLDGYKAQLAGKSGELTKALTEVTRLERELSEVNRQLAQTVSEKEAALRESQRVSVLYAALLEELKTQQTKLVEAENKLVAEKKEHGAALAELNQQIAELLAAQKAATAEKKRLSDECTEVKKQINELLTQSQQAEASRGQKNGELGAVKKDLAAVQTKLQETQRQLDESKAHVKSKDDLLAVKEVSITTFESKLGEATAELAATKKELNEMKRTVNELESNINKHNQEHDFDELLAQAALASSDSGTATHHVRGSMNVTRIVTSSVHSSTTRRESHTTHNSSSGLAETERVEVKSSSDSMNQVASKVRVSQDGETAVVSEVYSGSMSHKESVTTGKDVYVNKMITAPVAEPTAAAAAPSPTPVENEEQGGSEKAAPKSGKKNGKKNANKNKK